MLPTRKSHREGKIVTKELSKPQRSLGPSKFPGQTCWRDEQVLPDTSLQTSFCQMVVLKS